MCGISGVIDYREVEDFSLFASKRMHFISRRGPDGQGFYSLNILNFKIELSHSRLAIIDVTDQARQPMQDECSEWILTYNGEIFNYIEIREELKGMGWAFRSQSDTEVLLKAWSQWGVNALQRLNGMFAFAVVHRHTGEMWLVRDRFGVKPLLWSRTRSGGLVFSSSLAAVAQSIDADVNVDYCAFGLHYKAFEMPECQTAFLGVQALAPGCWIHICLSDAGLSVKNGQWYDLKYAVARKQESLQGMTHAELLEQCRHLLQDAVHVRLRSDVPLAVSLSGGLDSSTVASTASKLVDDLHGFTYGNPNDKRSEGPEVERFAREVGVTPHFIWPDLDMAGLDDLLERTLTCQEAPFPGLSVMAQNEVFRSVREAGFKVLLGGQGGDEIFAGYRKFFVVALRHALHNRDPIESIRLIYSMGLMLMHETGATRVYWKALNRYRTKSVRGFTLLDWRTDSANLWGISGGDLTARQIDDIQRWSISTLLRYEDRNSMGHGVETRLPFMDYRLVELALALPASLKIANGYGKWALRLITDGVVPKFIRLNRKKRGFDVAQTWIADGLGMCLRERINGDRGILSRYIKVGVNLNQYLTDEALQNDSNLLDEALMLAWLTRPVRE